MDISKIDNLIEKITKYSETHPNITKLWIDYLNLVKDKNNSTIIQAEYTLAILEDNTVNDIEPNNLLLLSIYIKSLE
jgi:hypothetical protein